MARMASGVHGEVLAARAAAHSFQLLLSKHVGASEACFHMPYAGIFPHTCLHGPVSS